MQVCSKCEVAKELEHFVWDKRYNRPKKKCRDCDAATNKEYRQRNKDKILARNKSYYDSNPQFRAKLKGYNLSRQPLYKATRTAAEAKRRSQKQKATPPWLNDDHIKQIESLYWLADDLKKVSGQNYHVDHIEPLNGKTICGLHVPWNLQVLPSDINILKSNKEGTL